MPVTASDTDTVFSRAPVLSAGSARLEPFARSHLTERYVAWLNDPQVVRYSENRHRVNTLAGCEAYVSGFRTGPGLLWAIMTDDLGHVGNVSVSVDVNNKIADIGILLGEGAARGRGLGLAVWTTVMSYLAGRGDIAKITGGCMEPNVAMVRIMQRSGMQPDGRRPRHYLLDGQRVDLVYHALYVPGVEA